MNSQPLLLICDHVGERAGRLPLQWAQGYRTSVTHHLRESLRELERERPALLVLLPLGESGAAEIAALDRARAGSPPVPMLVLLDPGALERQPGLRASAARQLVQVASQELGASEFQLAAERLEREAALVQELEGLRHRALYDDLTECLRPLAFEERMRAHFAAAQRHRFDVSLLLLDLDDFRTINKRFDHMVGDRVIQGAGLAIRNSLRAEDVAGRLGGDEFGVCLPYTNTASALLVAERIRSSIAALSRPADLELPPLRVSASIGVASFDGRNLPNLVVLRLHAERALRSAKEAGGDRCVPYAQPEPGSAPGTPLRPDPADAP